MTFSKETKFAKKKTHFLGFAEKRERKKKEKKNLTFYFLAEERKKRDFLEKRQRERE